MRATFTSIPVPVHRTMLTALSSDVWRKAVQVQRKDISFFICFYLSRWPDNDTRTIYILNFHLLALWDARLEIHRQLLDIRGYCLRDHLQVMADGFGGIHYLLYVQHGTLGL